MKKVDDQMRFWLPLIVVLLWVFRAQAELDLGIGSTVRSYPLSGVAELRAGYGVSLYGQPGTPFSGYLRPNIEFDSAGTYNSGLAQLEFFPLAFLGMRIGAESVQNDKDYTPYDCKASRCRGRFNRGFIGTDLMLGVGPVFVAGKWRREHWSQSDEQKGDFVEPTSGLLMREEGESQTVYYGVAGVKLGETWSVLGGVRYAEDDGGVSRMPFGMLRYQSGGFTVGAGAGTFESNLKKRDFTAWGYLAWDIIPSSVALK